MAASFPTFRRRSLNSTTRGFTLTEITIVLGVIGAIMAAVWAASDNVGNSNKVRNAQSDVSQILEGYRSIYTIHGVDTTGGDGTDITCLGATNGLFPPSSITGACTAGTTSTYPVNPWGGNYSAAAYPTEQGIGISISGVPQSACAGLAAMLVSEPDVIGEYINTNTNAPSATTAFAPWSITTAISYCVAGSNTIQVVFSK